EHFGAASEIAVVDGSERVGMTDRDAAAQPRGQGATCDATQLEGPEWPRVVKVDVYTDAAPFRDGEDGIEMTIDVSVDACGIQAAHEVGAHGHGRVEQVCRTWVAQDSALWKRDDLNVDHVLIKLLQAQHRLESRQSDLGVDVYVAANRTRPEAHDLLNQSSAPLLDRQRQRLAQVFLSADPLSHGGARAVRNQRQAKQRLVKVDVPVDERRRQQVPVAGQERVPISRQRSDRSDGRDATSLQQEVNLPSVRQCGFPKRQRGS
ncbi:MAG: hypothetical protein ACRYGP_04820, partial [Janthinobacterium lividum]